MNSTCSKVILTQDGYCPNAHVITCNDKIFIGNYPNGKWHHPGVKSYQQDILKARMVYSNQVNRQNTRNKSALLTNNQVLQRIQTKVKNLKEEYEN